MGEALHKRTRRELRRAMGREASVLVDSHTRVLGEYVIPTVRAVQERVEMVDQHWRADMVSARADAHRDFVFARADAHRDLREFTERSFSQRLRWLLFGH